MKKISCITITSLFFLSWCSLTTGLWSLACEFIPDGDHCQQFIAVQSWDPDRCERIKWEDWKEVGSNPPRDRCYLMIAENTWNLEICKRMKWGMYSYEPDDCLLQVALEHNLFDQCDQIKSYPSKYATCKTELVSLKNMSRFDAQIEQFYLASLQDWRNTDIQNKLQELQAQRDALFWYLSEGEQNTYFRSQREKIFESIYDEDVKTAIASQYNRTQTADMTVTQRLQTLKDIKDTQETLKRIDEHANTLHDEIMSTLWDMAASWKAELKEQLIQEVYKRSSESMKWELARLESLKSQYDTANAYYKDITEKYEKLKTVYDGVVDIQNKISAFDKMVADGKLTEDKAHVLKWAVLLGAWLEQVTAYVPVFWSTMSTISKETFDMVTRFATIRAQRTTAIDRCIDDPLNCDPDSITWY